MTDKPAQPNRVSAVRLSTPQSAECSGLLDVSVSSPEGCQFVSTWHSGKSALVDLLLDHIDMTPKDRQSRIFRGSAGKLLSVAPLTYALLDAKPFEFSDELGCISDQSHAFQLFKITGLAAEEFLSCLVDLDFRESRFGQKRVAATAIDGVGIHVWREEDGFHLLVPRSFAKSIHTRLEQSQDRLRPVFFNNQRSNENNRVGGESK